MKHADIIAYLYPYLDVDNRLRDSLKENPRYVPPTIRPADEQYERRERESTEPPEIQGASPFDHLPCLALKFSDIPRTNLGVVFGSSPRCDVILNFRGVSGCHFSLTFDGEGRLIVRDLGSRFGTQVTYDNRGPGARSDFRWIIGGHSVANEVGSIIITVQDTLAFEIVVPYHDISSPAYIDQVASFRRGRTAEHLLDGLRLSNPETRFVTGTHTPASGQIYLRKKLGEGGFGVVTRLWDVSTGSVRVVKEPSMKAIRRRQVNLEAWQREARIMDQVSHPHIVELISWTFDPHPRLYLEYIPCGSLDDHEDVTYNESLTILQQCLSALTYLHESETPIAHRDIKPANILVQSRFGGDICVKLGDFGLSRDSSELTTICGTQKYLAPEIYSEVQRSVNDQERLGYTATVDIWSLGVVACELVYGLPGYEDWHRSNGAEWCETIVEKLESSVRTRPDELGQFLLSGMLSLPRKSRFSAGECYRRAMTLPRIDDGEESATDSYTDGGQQATLLWQPRSWTDNNTTVSPHLARSVVPDLETSSSSAGVSRTEVPGVSKAPPSPAIQQTAGWQEGGEYGHFVCQYTSDPFDPLFVGSSLALELGGEDPSGWTSQTSRGSAQQRQATVVSAVRGPGSRSARSAIPRAGGHVQIENLVGGGGDLDGPDEYEEMEQAALLLQATGRGP